MSNLGKIIAWILIFSIAVFIFCVPAFASGGGGRPQPTPEGVLKQRASFSQWVGGAFQRVYGYSAGLACPNSEDNFHYANDYLSWSKDENGAIIYTCQCAGCGATFTAYESDLKQSYDNQVAELPATGITSAGRLIWQPTFADANANTSGSSDNYFRVSYYEGAYSCNVYLNAIPNCKAITIFSDNTGFICAYSNSYFKSRFGFYFNPVIAGSYRQIESLCYSYSCLDQSGTSYSGSVNYSAGTAFLHYDASTVLSSVRSSVFNICPDLSASATVTFGTVQYHFPVYEIIPDSAVDTSAGGQYSVTTRPTSITGGNYGIVGDDGEITTITNNNQIINETNNTYYNPATGETKPILDWSYNYTDRSYKVTLESGDTYTITYGDENIVIKEGDVTYNIYYMVDGTGSGDPDPSPSVSVCPHVWTETSRTEPGCTSPGKVVYTCFQCGQTKSETLKALGHDWQVERTVQTLYDENGNVTQQGYTIYQCSVCGEQYKDADSTGPPDNTVNDGGLIEWLNSLIKHLLDNLSGVVDLILSFFQEIPKLFGGFLDFLSAMFPYLPDDIIFLLTFGIAALVFVGVIKAIRR